MDVARTIRCTRDSFLFLLACAGYAGAAVAQDSGSTRRNFSTDPPLVAKAVATVLAKPTAAGNARVEVLFERQEVLPPQVPIFLETGRHLLRDDGIGGDRVAGDRTYTAIVPLDLKAIERRQQQLLRLQGQHGTLVMPIYQGRRLVRRLSLPASFFEPVQAGAMFPVDWWAFPPGIDPERSLVIRDPSVVEDPTRTYDPCTDTGTPMGKWTFGYLMSQIANPAYTGIDPETFVREWTQKMLTAQVVNGWTVAPLLGTDLVFSANTWPRISGTKMLDLAKAPFKLLAIVNRVDLRNNLAYGGANAGEARFVFGLNACPGIDVGFHKMTVILEYGISQPGCFSLKSWAQQWTGLQAHVLGSPAYNAALEAITDQFSLADAAPTRPNRSAINQVRINHGPVDAIWEFREFRLPGLGAAISHLSQSTVAQTPASQILAPAYPVANALSSYVNANEAVILADKHVVPTTFMGEPFRGGASTRQGGMFGWNSALIPNREARHKFALQTCNGCHFDETDTTGPLNTFFHIAPASWGNTAALSGFMTGIDVPDPFDGMPTRHFDELERRAVDLDGLANNICLTFLDTKHHKQIPLRMVH
jgi:hypothetical protein